MGETDFFEQAYNKYLEAKKYALNKQFNDPDFFCIEKAENLFYFLSSYNQLKLFKILESFYNKK